MRNADGNSNEAEVYQTWLLPELFSDKLITNENENSQRSGFQRQRSQNPEKKIRVDRRAMTESGLAELTQEVKEQGFSEGRAEGYNAGYSEGEKRAKEIAKTTLEQQQSCLQQLIESITQPIANERDLLKQVFTELIAEIAQQLCLRELKTDNGTISLVVEEAIASLPIGEKDIHLYFHPSDLATLEAMPDFLNPLWQLHGDGSLELGDCRVQSENSLVDFTRSNRLQTILADRFDYVIPERSNTEEILPNQSGEGNERSDDDEL